MSKRDRACLTGGQMKDINLSAFSDLAQDFVEATSSLVRGRTINIMDTDGIIIASTESAVFTREPWRQSKRAGRFGSPKRICQDTRERKRAITCPFSKTDRSSVLSESMGRKKKFRMPPIFSESMSPNVSANRQ